MGDCAMTQRLNYTKASPELLKKLTEITLQLRKGALEPSLINLLNIRASQINGCAFCVDMHIKEAKIQGERELRLHHIVIWRESPLFSERERTALEWTESVTRIADDGVPTELYERTRQQFSETEISELTFAIGIINTWNRLATSFRAVPGSGDKMFGLEKAGL
jgi:AhpD family alkylhydroperoxidase